MKFQAEGVCQIARRSKRRLVLLEKKNDQISRRLACVKRLHKGLGCNHTENKNTLEHSNILNRTQSIITSLIKHPSNLTPLCVRATSYRTVRKRPCGRHNQKLWALS
jgi:hypothetical protein